MPRGIYERKPRSSRMYCRSFYVRKDGTMYVQVGHDSVDKNYWNTVNTVVEVPIAGSRVIVGIHVDTKKCGIILSNWNVQFRGL